MALPRGSGAPTPAAVARALLDTIVAYYAAHEADKVDPPAPLPAARFVAAGEPRVVAWDRELGQVTVAYERSLPGHRPTVPPQQPGLPRSAPNRAASLVRSVALEVQIVRPAPGLAYGRRVPSVDVLDLHGYAVGVDLHHLALACRAAATGGDLLRDGVGPAEIVLGDCLTLGPSGKVAAVAQGLTVPLL